MVFKKDMASCKRSKKGGKSFNTTETHRKRSMDYLYEDAVRDTTNKNITSYANNSYQRS